MADGAISDWWVIVIVVIVLIATGAIWVLLDPLAAGIDVWTDTFW